MGTVNAASPKSGPTPTIKVVDFQILRRFKQAWDRSVAEAGGYAGNDFINNMKRATYREVANAVRDELNTARPDIARVAKEFHFWKTAQDVIDATVERTRSRQVPLSQNMMTAAGIAKGGVGTALLLRNLTKLTQSTGWNTTSAVLKDRLANLIEAGDIRGANAMLVILGANQLNNGKPTDQSKQSRPKSDGRRLTNPSPSPISPPPSAVNKPTDRLRLERPLLSNPGEEQPSLLEKSILLGSAAINPISTIASMLLAPPQEETIFERQVKGPDGKYTIVPPSQHSVVPRTTKSARKPILASAGLARPVNRRLPSLHEMSLDELDILEKQARVAEKSELISIFGKKAPEYERLSRSANSYDPKKADEASRAMNKMESKLPKTERNKLFGIGGNVPPSFEEIREYKRALNSLDFGSAEDLGDSLKYALAQVGKETDPAKMRPQEKIRYAQLRYAYSKARDLGFDLKKVFKSSLEGVEKIYSDDSAEILSRFLPPPR